MSFIGERDIIADGDIVILHLGLQNMLKLKIEKGKSYQTKWGCLRHDDVIGKSFGSCVKCPKGYVYVLKPTPELWTINLTHRTQILYSTDISLITMQLDLSSGSVVVESGTGSGSLSHALIRTIAPEGHLYTYEFHEQRSATAREEFTNHGLADYVTVSHRDVIENGFNLPDKADAVFLDLPNPQNAVHHAKDTLKVNGRLCSFSPCIEQVQNTCSKMAELGFVEITTMECLLRTFDVRTLKMSTPNMGEMNVLSYVTDDLPGILTNKDGAVTFKSAVAPAQQPGHTGYLTFATLYTKQSNTKIEDAPK